MEIRFARSETEREAVFRFRFEVFVEELGRQPSLADYQRRLLFDDLDETAHILAAYEGEQVVGTLRTNFLRECDSVAGFPFLATVTPRDRYHTSVTTRAAVGAVWRGGTLFARLARAVFRFGVENDIRFDFIVSRAGLQEQYRRLGYRPFGDTVLHPDAGQVLPMRLDLWNVDHLREVGSPFAPLVARARAI